MNSIENSTQRTWTIVFNLPHGRIETKNERPIFRTKFELLHETYALSLHTNCHTAMVLEKFQSDAFTSTRIECNVRESPDQAYQSYLPIIHQPSIGLFNQIALLSNQSSH